MEPPRVCLESAAGECQPLLERLAAGDETSLRAVLSPTAESQKNSALDRRTRALVQLSALVAMDAATCSLGWAAEVAATNGVDDGTIVRALYIAASVAGLAATAGGAERLALAMGMDTSSA